MSPMHRRQHGFADDKPDRAAIEKEINDITTVTKRNTYRLGELWIQVMKHELWKDAGSHSPQEYLTQTFPTAGLTVKTMSIHAAIARDFLADDLIAAGEYRLTLLQSYARLMSIDQLESPAKIPILVPVGSKVVSKPFEECSETDLHSAITHAGGGDDSKPLPEEKHKKLEAMKTSLDGLTHSPVHVTGKMVDDKLSVTIADVMEDELGLVLNALSAFTESVHGHQKAKG